MPKPPSEAEMRLIYIVLILAIPNFMIGGWAVIEFVLGIFHWFNSSKNIEKKLRAKKRLLKGLKVMTLTFLVWVVIYLIYTFIHKDY